MTPATAATPTSAPASVPARAADGPAPVGLARLTGDGGPGGIFDELSKREVRRAALTAVAVPGYQVPFGSREMPVARGWGSGGLQVTLALAGPDDRLKVIDQGEDAGVNASNLRRLIVGDIGAAEVTDTREATLVQSRHRIPETPLRADQTLVLQVPVPEPLRAVESDMTEQRRMHAEADYSKMWVSLYEDLVRNGVITQAAGYPCLVDGRYVISPTPIPRFDVPKLSDAEHLTLFGAGREKRIYAVPPHTRVEPLAFDDVPFQVEHTPGASCAYCGADDTYLVEEPSADGGVRWLCSDTDFCARNRGDRRGPGQAAPSGGARPAPLETPEERTL
jgi:alpha-D-ribose 1-methylphosphonate 5-phosphate C-P lyase